MLRISFQSALHMPLCIYPLFFRLLHPEADNRCPGLLLTSLLQTVCHKMAVLCLPRIPLMARNGSCPVSASHHQGWHFRSHPGQTQILYLRWWYLCLMRTLHIFCKVQWCSHAVSPHTPVLCPDRFSPDWWLSAQSLRSHHDHRSQLLWMVCRSAQEVSRTLLILPEAWCRRQYRSRSSLPSRFL